MKIQAPINYDAVIDNKADPLKLPRREATVRRSAKRRSDVPHPPEFEQDDADFWGGCDPTDMVNALAINVMQAQGIKERV